MINFLPDEELKKLLNKNTINSGISVSKFKAQAELIVPSLCERSNLVFHRRYVEGKTLKQCGIGIKRTSSRIDTGLDLTAERVRGMFCKIERRIIWGFKK